jgi:GNAT superfamily N-acetyltransferase
MEIELATPEDAEEILALVHAAFGPVAREYGMRSLPPLEDTLPDLLEQFRTHTILKAVEGDRIVGSVRGVMWRGTCEVGRLVVGPAFEGRGVGSALAKELEARFPDSRRFELFTGHRSGPSLHIYAKLGYVPFRLEPVSDTLQLVYLVKPGPAA